MKSWIKLIFTAILAVSCTSSDFDRYESIPKGFLGIDGCIIDSIGNPIEHLKVTITVSGDASLTVYTASDGKFTAEVMEPDAEEPFIDIVIEDIDGEENGGYFGIKTDRIAIIPDDRHESPVILSPVYRLNPSTALESTPQNGQTDDGN